MAMLIMIAALLHDTPVNQMPEIRVIAPTELHQVCQSRCTAAYVPHVVYLSSDLDIRQPRDLGILFHELVHHHQEIRQRYASYSECDRWNQREIEAYRLQNIWYEENRTGTRTMTTVRPCHD